MRLLILIKKLFIILGALKSQKRKRVIVALGDSWFNLAMFNFKGLNIDTVDWLRHYGANVIDVAIPGYKLEDEIKYKLNDIALYSLRNVQKITVIISLGGNDIAWNFQRYVYGRELEARFNKEKFLIDFERSFYVNMSKLINGIIFKNYNANVIIHGYDYFHPEIKILGKTGFFQKIFNSLEIPPFKRDEIIKDFIDTLNKELSKFASNRVKYLDLRWTLSKDDWMEQIHPTPLGYKKIAKRILSKINDA